MIDRRNIVIVALCAVPVLVSLGFGVYAMWITGFWKILFWVFPACWFLAWLLGKLLPRREEVSELAALTLPQHATHRDQAAAGIVRKYQEAFASTDPSKLLDPQHYVGEIQAMAREMAVFYRDAAADQDPMDSLTLVELSGAIRLAVDDMEEIVLTTVPGSQVLTVGQWKRVAKSPEWIRNTSNLYWAASILLNPLNLVRYGASQVTSKPVLARLQTELVGTLYMRFIRQSGFYLIEMYSGRLRAGATEYRQGLESRATDPIASLDLTIAVLGQSGAGKSSLINALVPTANAKTGRLPETQTVESHQWEMSDPETGETSTLSVLDTPGYGAIRQSTLFSKASRVSKATRASKAIETEIHKAIDQGDVILLVLDAHCPAKDLDLEMVRSIHKFAATSRNRKQSPIVAVLTHVDLLPPATQWMPPYQIDVPTNAKEQSIRGACDYVNELFGDLIEDVVPVCLRKTDQESAWNIDESLIPCIISRLEEGRIVSLMKAYEAGLDKERWRRIAEQTQSLLSSGRQMWVN